MDRKIPDPKRQDQSFGRLFTEMRKARGITQDALTENLMTQRGISRLEQNGILPGALVLDVLLQRLGASSQFFLAMLSQHEYEYLCWKKEILTKIENGTICSEDWDSPMARSRCIHEGLQGQFADFWKGYMQCDTDLMDRAIARTVTGYPKPLSDRQCLGTEEICYILLGMERRLSACPGQWGAVKPTLQSVLCYIETNTPAEERTRVYARAVCLYGEYMADASPEEKIRYYRRALKLHRKQAVLTGLCDILRGLLRESEFLSPAERGEYERGLWALTWVKKEFQVEEPSLMHGKLDQEFCLLHEVLGAYRLERRLRVRDIDENVCSEKTYRALEAGKRVAKRGTYQALSDYMSIPLGSYNGEIISDSYCDLALAAEIKNLLHRQQDETALHKLNELEQRLGDKAQISLNAQFIASIRNIMLFEAGDITADEYQRRVEAAIRLTIPEWDIDYGTHFYTQREMTLVYYDAIIFRKKKDYDTAIRLLRMLWDQLEQSSVSLIHRSNEALLINTLWKDLLTDIKDYDGALEKVKIGVELSFATGNGAFLDVLTLEPGWIMNVREEDLSNDDKMKCCDYFRNAFYISKLYGRKRSQKNIFNYCKQNGVRLIH